MKAYRFVDDGSINNFGDDLNRWLWRRLVGQSLDIDDGTLLLGIGTVISRNQVPMSTRYVVLGSGTGPVVPPPNFGGPEWNILSVRGPLTAAVLGLPANKAITDGAALLRLLPECQPLPLRERAGVAFMPHYASLQTTDWNSVCKLAGFEFLNPFVDSELTVQRIRKARLVIADAMHAAIVADALRVPWIPVVSSPASNTFKWLDWTMSLNLRYKPFTLSAGSLLEAIRGKSLKLCAGAEFFKDQNPVKAIEHYRRARRLKSWKYFSWYRWRMTQLTYSIPERIVTSTALHGFKEKQDDIRMMRLVDQLTRIAAMPPCLSDERVFGARLQRMANLLATLGNRGSNGISSGNPRECSIPSTEFRGAYVSSAPDSQLDLPR